MRQGKTRSGNIMIKLAPPKWEEVYDARYKMKKWGVNNDYPQVIQRLLDNSPNGSMCVRRYADFIFGNGIEGGDELMVNSRQCLNDLVQDAATDLAYFGGFAFHLRYNALGEIIGVKCIPFETLRLGEEDDLGYNRGVIYCPDWCGVKTRNGKQVNPGTDGVNYLLYSDSPDTILDRLSDSPETYKGDVMYVSNRNGYPKGRACYIATALSTDEGITNTMYRNARTSFSPTGIVTCLQQEEDENKSAFFKDLSSMQGDENVGSILAVTVSSMEEKPEFVSFEGTNYDQKLLTTTGENKEIIYSAFKQEPFFLLRQGKIGFGGEVVTDAYRLLSLEVRPEQKMIERALKRLAKRSSLFDGVNIEISPLIFKSDVE